MHAWGEMKDDMNKEHVYRSCTPNTTLLSSASVAPPTSSVFIHMKLVQIFSGEIYRYTYGEAVCELKRDMLLRLWSTRRLIVF